MNNKMMRTCILLLYITLASCSSQIEPQGPGELQEPADQIVVTVVPRTEIAQPTASEPSEREDGAHRIGIRQGESGAEFYDRGSDKIFVPRGVNYFFIVPVGAGLQDRFFGLQDFDAERVRMDFESLRSRGYNTVRIFLDTCNGGTGCIGNQDGTGLNPKYLDNIVHTMHLAQEVGLYLLLTSNDLPEQGGYWQISDRGISDQFGPYRNSHYLTKPGVEAGRQYWKDLMRGLAEREAPFSVILGWSLLNEQWFFYTEPPFSLNSGNVTAANGKAYNLSDPEEHRRLAIEGMRHYIARLRDVILTYDPEALITMGFFVPDYPNPIRQGDFRYVETAGLLEAAALDFFDFHGYPGEYAFALLAENFGLPSINSKPVILGEAGAFLDRYPSLDSAIHAIKGWIAESCEYGFDGWLYWGLYRAPEAIGDATWGFLDAEQQMMDAMSVDTLPDPCLESLRPPKNQALGKDVIASRWLAEEPPGYAVDGKPQQWGAGSDAPQWIQIDLGAPQTLTLVRLVVAQWPAGETTHQIWGRGPGQELMLLHVFQGVTEEGQLLEFVPDESLEPIQILRIVTLQSPSWVAWKEIEVFAE
ncbi:MAG: discoidin domain-containing protein [Chloroflexi bacterium]|nr:discoidin domain-containing protein [Chloroflexota bacterium]